MTDVLQSYVLGMLMKYKSADISDVGYFQIITSFKKYLREN